MKGQGLDTSFGLPRGVCFPSPPKMPPAPARYWDESVQAGQEFDVCPILLCSFHWRETRSGDMNIPKGPEGTGDWDLELDPTTGKKHRVGELGHGRGLCQIDDRKHVARLAWVDAWLLLVDADGVPLWKKPLENIRTCARIYAENRLIHGPIGGVASYNTKDVWVEKVLTEIQPRAAPQELVSKLDKYTSPRGRGDYVADVLANRARWQNGWRAGVGSSV